MLPRLYRTESEIRQRQINTLKIFNDNVTEVQQGSEYSISFTAGSNELCLLVLLSNEFPQEKPFLKITPTVLHPWVNGEGDITSAPGLLNFTIHSDLGRVVQAIIREFERTPPPLATDQANSITSPSVPARVFDADIMGRGSSFSYAALQNFTSPTHISQSVTFPELNLLSLDELKFLNGSIESQEEFIANLPQIKEMDKMMDELILNIEELADNNLAKRERFEYLNKEIDSKMNEVTKLAYENENLNAKYQLLSEKYSPKNIKDKLQQAADKTNMETERVAEAFLQGELDIDKFLSSYIQIRTLSQTRKTKEEKLSQQLQNLAKAGF